KKEVEVLECEQNIIRNWNLIYDPQPKNPNPREGVKWTPPRGGFLKLNFDGAAKGNPGKAGGGGVFRDDEGKFLLAYFFNLGIQSNNVAEVVALFWGVKLVEEKGFKHLVVEGDSLYIISCVKGVSQASISIVDFINKSKGKLSSFETISFQHVFREGNKLADILANMGVDAKELKVVEDLKEMDANFIDTLKRERIPNSTPFNEDVIIPLV
ncbi:hypothetical protein KI387_028023, partial [Taxus chinensis]